MGRGRRAQLRVGALNLAVIDINAAPFNADPISGGPTAPAAARAEIRADLAALARGLATGSGVDASADSLAAARAEVASIRVAVDRIYRFAARPQGIAAEKSVPGLQQTLLVRTRRLLAVLTAISRTDAARAQQARLEAAVGTALAMLALVGVFLIFYVRSHRARTAAERLVRENTAPVRPTGWVATSSA